jgi:hypothetical protein
LTLPGGGFSCAMTNEKGAALAVPFWVLLLYFYFINFREIKCMEEEKILLLAAKHP